jgi:hypothetical protein
MWTYLLFAFIAVGSKLLLALLTIYLLLPADRRCDRCDGETLPLRMGVTGRAMGRLLRRHFGRRWCPSCGWSGYARLDGRRPFAHAPGRGSATR